MYLRVGFEHEDKVRVSKASQNWVRLSLSTYLKMYDHFRLESVAVVISDGLEDPLDDVGMVTQQLDQISVIGRCEYGKTCSLLVQLFDQAAQAYQEMISNMNTSKIEATIQEGRLTWLVYIIGAAVGGRVSFNR